MYLSISANSYLLRCIIIYQLSLNKCPLLISASISERPPSRSPTDCAAPDIDAECLHTLQSLVDHYAPSHPLAEQLLTSHANLDWLARDLVYGSSLPDERVSSTVSCCLSIQLVEKLRQILNHEIEIANELQFHDFTFNGRLMWPLFQPFNASSSRSATHFLQYSMYCC